MTGLSQKINIASSDSIPCQYIKEYGKVKISDSHEAKSFIVKVNRLKKVYCSKGKDQ